MQPIAAFPVLGLNRAELLDSEGWGVHNYRTGRDTTLGAYDAFVRKLGPRSVRAPVGPSDPNADPSQDPYSKNHEVLRCPLPRHLKLLVGRSRANVLS